MLSNHIYNWRYAFISGYAKNIMQQKQLKDHMHTITNIILEIPFLRLFNHHICKGVMYFEIIYADGNAIHL